MNWGRGGRRTSPGRPSALEVGASQRLPVHDDSFPFILSPRQNQFRPLSLAVVAAVLDAGIGSILMTLFAKGWSPLIGWMGDRITPTVSTAQRCQLPAALQMGVSASLRPASLDPEEET